MFVLERVKIELEKQIAAAIALDKKKPSSSISNINKDEQDDEDVDYDDNINESYFFEDLRNTFDQCAFESSTKTKCLTNRQVYKLLNNKSDLIKFSKVIEQQINNPNEQMCTSIDLSLLF